MNDPCGAAYVLFLQWLFIAPLRKLNSWRKGLWEGALKIFQDKTVSQKALGGFLKANTGLWRNIDLGMSLKKEDSYILVEGLLEAPSYIMTNLLIARYVMGAYGLPAAGLLNRPDAKVETIFRSYGISKFYYLSDRKQGWVRNIKNAWKVVQLLKGIRNMDDFLKLNFNGISVGKIVYDNYLRSTGFGTLAGVDWRVFEGLTDCVGHIEHLEEFFETKRFPVLIQAEKQFIPYALVCQSALKNGTVIYSRGGGPTTFTLRRYDDLGQYYFNPHRPSNELFEHILKNCRQQGVRGGEEHIHKRFSGEPAPYDIPDAALAFKKDDRKISRQGFCDQLGWDPSRPIVGIMANNLIDGVFTDNWELFRDYLTWFRETLKTIRNIDGVNWFVRPHPTDKLYNIKTTIKGEYEWLAGDCKHIRYFPEHVAGSSISDIVDVILTVRGSAGVEYSCYGIPCVIAGEALYTGFGFTHEPRTQEQYFDVLRNIRALKRLDKDQIERAKIFVYIYGVLSRVKAEFIPHFSPFGDDDEKDLLEKAAALAASVDPKEDRLNKMIQIQVERKYRHLLNYDWIGGGTHSDPCSSS